MFLNNIEDKIDTSSAATGGEAATFGDMVSAEYNAGRLAGSSTSRETALYQAYDNRTRAVDGALGQLYHGATSNLRNPFDAAPIPDDMTDAQREEIARNRADPFAEYDAQLKKLSEQYPLAANHIAPERSVLQDAQALARQAVQTQTETAGRAPGALTQFAAENIGALGSLMRDSLQQATFLLAPEAKIGLAGLQGLLAHSLWGASKMALAQASAEPLIQPWRGEADLPHGFREAGSEIAGAFESGLLLELGGRGLIRGTRKALTGHSLPEGKIDKALQGEPQALREVSNAVPGDSALRGAADAAEQQSLFPPPEHVDNGEHLDRLASAIQAVHEDETAPPPGDAAILYAKGKTERPRFTDETAATPHMVEGKPVYFREVSPAEVQTDANTFQFKSDGDSAGVTQRLKGVTRWDPLASGKTMAFERADGSMVIADGHQRLGLAKRLMEEGQNPVLQAFVFREKDGWQPADVRAYAAMKNLKELSGTALDMARIMRERPDLVDGSLPLSDNKMREAVALARLSPDAFGMVANGIVPEPYAALVGDSVTGASRHASLLDEMMRLSPQNVQQARLYMSQILSLPTATEHQISLFGDEERVRSLMAERVRVLDSALKSLSTDKRIFSLLDREAKTIERAGNVLAGDENAARASRAAELDALIEKLSFTRGQVSDLLNNAADAMANRGVRTKIAADALVRRIGDILDQEGLSGLTRDRAIEQPPKLEDGIGPEAEKQTEILDKASDLKELAKEPKEEPRMMFAIAAYHGSPHDFERFDISKIGTGEGAQAFGHGLYFAGNPEVAENYKAADRRAKDGRLYQVSIDVEPEHLLDWDKPLSEQPEAIKQKILSDKKLARAWHEGSKYEIPSGQVESFLQEYNGYEWMLRDFKGTTENAASEALKNAGIPGIRYLDGGSRGAGEGSHNYVIFDDKLVKITHKDGRPVSDAERADVVKQLFALRQTMRDPGLTLTPAAMAAKENLRGEVSKLISEHLPPEWKAEIRDRLTFGDLPDETRARFGGVDPSREFWGHMDPVEKILYVSMAADNPLERAHEEIWHMIDETALPQADRAIIDAAAEEGGWREKLKIEERYGKEYGAAYKDKDRLEAALQAETRAQMLATRAVGENFGRAANGVLDRLLSFFEAVRNMLKGRGFQTLDDVFAKYERGEYSRMVAGAEGGEARFAKSGKPDSVEDYAKAGTESEIGGKSEKDPSKFADIIRQAKADGKISPGEAQQIMRLYRNLRAATGSANAAAQRVAKLLQEEAALRKRQALKQVAARKNAESFMQKFRDGRGQPDPARAIVGLIENIGHHVFPEGMQDVVGRAKAVEALATSKLQELLDAFHPHFFSGRTPNKARLENVVRELFGENTGDVMAARFAKAWTEASEDLRQRFNAAGGAIGKLDKWGLPQEHSRRALIMAGKEKWKAAIKPLLDRTRTVHALTRLPMTDAELDASLNYIHDTITSDGWNERKATAQRRGLGALANQRSDQRFLHFKDADSWLKYQRDYGAGDNPLSAMMSHVHGMSQDIGAMEILGPNPRATLTYLQNFVTKQAELKAAGQPAHFPNVTQNLGKTLDTGGWWLTSANPSAYGAKAVKLSEDMWNTFRGYTGAVVSPELADAMQTVRNVGGAAKLGSVLASTLNDVTFQLVARKLAGMPGARLLGDYLKGFSPDDAARALAGVDKAAHQMNAEASMAQSWNGKSVSRYLQNRVLQWGLVEGWTHAGRAAYSEGVMSHLGQEAENEFAQLHPLLQRAFARYGMGETDWNALRATPQNAGRIEPDGVYRNMEAQGRSGERLAERYLGMILHEAQYTQHLNPLRVTAFMAGLERGSVKGEALRGMAQFRTFVGWYATMWGGRVAAEMASQGALKTAPYAAGLMIGLTLFGVLRNQLVAISSGKDPEPLTHPAVWAHGLIQGGGMGIYGDFLQSAENRFGGGLAETVAGPQVAMASDLLKLTYGTAAGMVKGEKVHPGREGVRFLKNYTPGSNLWYLRGAYERILLDQVQRFVDPQAHEAFRKRLMDRQRDYHSGFWWRPGEMTPERAPDMGNLLGH